MVNGINKINPKYLICPVNKIKIPSAKKSKMVRFFCKYVYVINILEIIKSMPKLLSRSPISLNAKNPFLPPPKPTLSSIP